jgi:SAM-dependent methyltransferase
VTAGASGHAHSHASGAVHDGGGPGLNPFVEGWLDRLAGDGPVLDLGCGHGFWTSHMAERGMRVVGIEPEVERVAEAAASARAPVVAGDGSSLPFGDATVGLVWCIHVLHHLDDPVRVLAEIRRVLRPGGHLVLAETVEDNPVVRVGRRVRPEWDGVPVRSRFTAATLAGLLGEAGFSVADRRQHSLLSFAAWALPKSGRRAWLWLTGVEDRLPPWTARWGAHVEVVARRP